MALNRSSAAPVSLSGGTRPPGCTTSICVQPMPPAIPVPSAFDARFLGREARGQVRERVL